MGNTCLFMVLFLNLKYAAAGHILQSQMQLNNLVVPASCSYKVNALTQTLIWRLLPNEDRNDWLFEDLSDRPFSEQ